MKKTALLLFGAAVISAAAGGITAIGVNKYLSHHSLEGGAQESMTSMWDRSEPQVGNHFTAFQAEQYPDLTYAAENAVQAVAEELTDTGRILVRESGTEPVVRVMVEAETKEQCQILAERVVNVIREKGHTV